MTDHLRKAGKNIPRISMNRLSRNMVQNYLDDVLKWTRKWTRKMTNPVNKLFLGINSRVRFPSAAYFQLMSNHALYILKAAWLLIFLCPFVLFGVYFLHIKKTIKHFEVDTKWTRNSNATQTQLKRRF